MNVSGPDCLITEDMLAILTPLIQKCVFQAISKLYCWNANEIHGDPTKQMEAEVNYFWIFN